MSIVSRFSRRKQVAGDFKKQMKKLIRSAKEQGWKVEQTRNNHYQFFPPDKEMGIVTVAGTPSDYRAWKNIRSELKRNGFDWPWDETKPDVDDSGREEGVEEEQKDFNVPDFAEEQETQEAKDDIKFLDQLIKDGVSPREINEYTEMMGPDKLAYRKAYKEK